MKYTANYNLKKPEGTDIVNIDDLNDNADILDQKLKELENGVNNAPPNSVNDAAIGSRTPDQSQAPASPGTGTLTQLISWLANRIKAITGKTNWWDAPPTTLQAAKTHMDAAAPHSGHETPSGAQAKADGAEARAKAYTDQEVGEVSQALDAHKAENASTTAKGHVQLNNTVTSTSTTQAATANAVKTVNDALTSHKAANIVVHGVARGTSTFAGYGQERAIAHGLGETPRAAYATPTEDPQGRLGEVWIRMTSTHLYVGNSGSFTGGMSWVAFL